MEDGLLDAGKVSSLRRQIQQRIDEIAKHVEIAGDKDEP
jgi:hypothetical protein